MLYSWLAFSISRRNVVCYHRSGSGLVGLIMQGWRHDRGLVSSRAQWIQPPDSVRDGRSLEEKWWLIIVKGNATMGRPSTFGPSPMKCGRHYRLYWGNYQRRSTRPRPT